MQTFIKIIVQPASDYFTAIINPVYLMIMKDAISLQIFPRYHIQPQLSHEIYLIIHSGGKR